MKKCEFWTTFKMRIREIFLCWDIWAAICLCILLFIILPPKISCSFAKDMSVTAINVLVIIFSVFFAVLSIMISSGTDDFIEFLEKKEDFTGIMINFKMTFKIIFGSLVLIIFYYGMLLRLIGKGMTTNSLWLFIFFSFLFLYSLFAFFNASLDAMTFSQYRVEFFKQKNNS